MKQATPQQTQEARPEYRVTEIAEGGHRGWQIEIRSTARVRYRVVSGYEQVVERESDYLYLCVVARGHRGIGFKFRCTRPRVTHTVGSGATLIKLLIIE